VDVEFTFNATHDFMTTVSITGVFCHPLGCLPSPAALAELSDLTRILSIHYDLRKKCVVICRLWSTTGVSKGTSVSKSEFETVAESEEIHMRLNEQSH
jgi:hypothetical protein